MTSLHNETLNIATHFFGALITLSWVYQFVTTGRGYELFNAASGDHFTGPTSITAVIAIADVCSFLCFLGSARYHTLMAAAPDEAAYKRLLADDLAGVILVNAVSLYAVN